MEATTTNQELIDRARRYLVKISAAFGRQNNGTA
jgi:hypothetical protein